VYNAQQAGAIAAVIFNSFPGTDPNGQIPGPILGSDNRIAIPSVMVSLEDGTILKDTQNVSVSIFSNPIITSQRDALLQIYDSLNGDSWSARTGWTNRTTFDPCRMYVTGVSTMR
jgi:hypothetical protein